MPMLPEPVFKSCVNVRSAAFSIAGAARRSFGAMTSRGAPPSATRTGPITMRDRSRPPLTRPIRTGSTNPGTLTVPPLLESAADWMESGQPCRIMPPVKYWSAMIPSATSGWKARYQASKSEA